MAARTYGNLIDRILDEMLNSVTTSQVQLAIQDAISYYEEEPLYFNESRDTVFSLSSSQEFYTSADSSTIPLLFDIEEVTVTLNANRYTLIQRSYDWVENASTGQQYTSLPAAFCYWQQQLRIWPIPNQGMPCRVSSIVKQPTLSATTDSNMWTTDAEPLIRMRAKADLYLNIRRDAQQAMEMTAGEQQYLQNLYGDSVRRTSTGMVTPSNF